VQPSVPAAGIYAAPDGYPDRLLPSGMRVRIRLNLPSKYRVRRTDGYASQKEARRAGKLKLLERLGEIRDLRQQVRFELVPQQAKGRAISYIADFCWIEVVEDVKGVRAAIYKLKPADDSGARDPDSGNLTDGIECERMISNSWGASLSSKNGSGGM
jgi:Protein of unknown function (DUF1064)